MHKRSTFSALHRRGHHGGFTLVEILVALAIGMVILAALAVIFSRQSGNQSELERSTRQIENARFALDLLAEDLMHAGYYSDFNPDPIADPVQDPTAVPPENGWALAGPCVTSLASLGWASPPLGGATAPKMPVAVEGIAAGAASTPACLEQRLAGTEAITIRHAETGDAIPLASVTAGDLYLQTSRCQNESPRFLVSSTSGDLTLSNPTLPCGTTLNNAVRRLVQRTYFISACNDCNTPDGIPTLKRAEWRAGALQITALAEGIENLQFDYGLDTNGDGQPDSFAAQGGVTGAGAGNEVWNNVVSVRIHLLARATEASPGYVDGRTYALGVGGVEVTPGDAFRRRVLSATVRLMNVGGRRE